ncbi:LysE family translocator [Salinicola peritrichatus]|uniref:LysE family translocator n=1 Tax=Salinicola peritrichatus TaxID=1267424 RepID=UPI000DA1E9C8|nr:LysE family translocator [Salinicola peritrichatus]
MPLDTWLAFVLASAIMLAIPGPTILLVVSHALSHGRRAAGATVGGVALGDLTAMTASMAGLGALLATSAMLFSVLKWIGAAYLIYLGIKAWRAPVALDDGEKVPDSNDDKTVSALFWHAYTVTTFNPKSLIFFVAFVPQFLTPHHALMPQVAIMEATFIILATLNAAFYGLLASSARERIRQPRVQRVANRIGGSVLVGAGCITAIYQRNQ